MVNFNSRSNRRSNWLLWLPLGLGLIVSGCAGKSFSDFLPSAAGAVGAAVCTPAGPGAAAFCAGAAATGTEVAIPSRTQRSLSSDPRIAEKQLEAEEKEALLRVFETWGIYIIVLFAFIFWIAPDPMKILDRFRRKQ